MTETEAEAEILRRCRATRAGGWVMRAWGTPERCYVINLREREQDPHDRRGRRARRIAEGANWLEVFAALPPEDSSR